MLGFFRRKKEPEQRVVLAYPSAAVQPEEKRKAFSIDLSWKGLFGLLLIFFLLQMWMFLLGMWAAQTIVFPTSTTALPAQEKQQKLEITVEQQKPSASVAEDQAGPAQESQ
ncbi:MAG: hypothetical protein GX087_07640 [Desulfobulbaceae bacterium]|nr:hypothetical protein [Desulfobulbaceae bacterium]